MRIAYMFPSFKCVIDSIIQRIIFIVHEGSGIAVLNN